MTTKGDNMVYAAVIIIAMHVASPAITGAEEVLLSAVEQLGKHLFFDNNLSDPPGQSCATCHNPAAGWTGGSSEINAGEAVYRGARQERSGSRKPPSAAYAAPSPVFHYDQKEGNFVGGNFWDGRATGWLLGNPAAEQAQGPFVNPVEQNMLDEKAVVQQVCSSAYASLFRQTYGEGICQNTIHAYNAIGQALASFESSGEVNAFTSKYDHYLKNPRKYPLTGQELRGLRLYEDRRKGNCAACHPNRPDSRGRPPLFTDFTYDNLGMPKNPGNPWYKMPKEINPDGAGWVDTGLSGFLGTVARYARHAEDNLGKHKVPTLRNVDKRPYPDFVKAFGHNGYFKDLKAIVHFYNVRDVLPQCGKQQNPKPGTNCWPEPEVSENINTTELGNLGLTEAEEMAIVAFLRTLSDGWSPQTGIVGGSR
jgi:cytochrome c peroxidase